MDRHNDPLPTTHCEFYVRAYIETTLYHMYFFSFTYNSIQLLGMWSKTFILIYKPLSHHTRTRTHTQITSHSNNSILHIPLSYHTHTPITSHSNNSILHIPLSYHTHTPITSHSSTYPYHIIHTPITAHSNNSYTYPYHITLKYIHVPQSHHT